MEAGSPVRSVVLDACCLINLLASGKLAEIAAAGRHRFYIPSLVAAETLYVRQCAPDNPQRLVPCGVDLGPLIAGGTLVASDLQRDDVERFVRLASDLDDGEAAAIAIAAGRKWTLATDDRVAARAAAALEVPMLATAEILRAWSEIAALSPAEIGAVLADVQRFGRFRPRAGSAECDWWRQCLAAFDRP
jgi:hypothetical protein